MFSDVNGPFEEALNVAFSENRRSSKRILKRGLAGCQSEKKSRLPTASMDSDDDDLEIISFTDNIKWFYPIDSHWQRAMCEKFGLKLKKELDFKCNVAVPALAPLKVHDIQGDGNCYFRCLSYLITGTDKSFNILRQKLVKFMKENEKLVEGLGGRRYISNSLMWVDGTWPTEVEIYASACMLDTDIYTYVDDKWLMFCSKGKLVISETIRRSIYLLNHENVHYDIVVSVQQKLPPLRVFPPAANRKKSRLSITHKPASDSSVISVEKEPAIEATPVEPPPTENVPIVLVDLDSSHAPPVRNFPRKKIEILLIDDQKVKLTRDATLLD